MAVYRSWCFTVNNPEGDEPYLDFTGDDKVRYAVWQKEKAPETGTEHLQGYAEFKQAMRMTGVKKINGLGKAHLEARMGSRKQARDYCMKADSRIAGPWQHGDFDAGGSGARNDIAAARDAILAGEDIDDVALEHCEVAAKYPQYLTRVQRIVKKRKVAKLEVKAFRPWQAELLAKLELEPDARKVMWYYDTKGNTGKSFMARYLVQHKGAFYCNGGKGPDIAYSYDCERIAIFDFPREYAEYINYGVIEQVKNGMLFSSKYESGLKLCDIPHVVIFANFEPDRSKLSCDRWDVINLSPMLGGVYL